MFCKKTAIGAIPKYKEFEPLTRKEDISCTTLISLCIQEDSLGVDMKFAGSARVSIGFMQSIIEVLTKPGDIVFDWSIGEGWGYYAGDYCGRHVIGLDRRSGCLWGFSIPRLDDGL